MSSLYRPLPELMFSTPWFRRLSANAKLVIITLAAGPCATGCPGLAIADAFTLVSLVGLAIVDVEASMAELTNVGAIEVDDDHRLVRLPWCPKMRTSSSEKTLRGWFGVWKELPDCSLKYTHIESLRDAADLDGKCMPIAWDETFGAVQTECPTDAHGKGMPRTTDHVDVDVDVTKTKTKTKRRRKRNEGSAARMAPTEPMPFTIEVGLETLASHSKGAIITSPYDADLSSTLTAVIRKHPDLADWQLVAEHAAAGSFSWMKNSKPGLKWIAKTGNMADAIGLARDWNAAGRPSNTSPKPTHTGWTQPASHNAESTTVEDF